MHGRLVTWFLWGFCQMLAPIATSLLAMIGMAISPTLGSILGGLGGCVVGCGGLAWWIAGIVWRFRSDGAFAVGDIIKDGVTAEEWEKELETTGSLYQSKSGKFMAIYYFICFGFMGLSLLCGIVTTIWGCIAAKKNEE